ncbi:MAG TPA: hypothetical protein VI997_06595 [Candidatus Thermoplasmatota archaeon]|nr:hypothetical protein [Candidatus Thermoplasmatota archaeon]
MTFGEKYVERAEKALVESVALIHARQMPMTPDDCYAKIQGFGWSQKVDLDFVKDCYRRLDRDGHLKEENGRYTITDDGREDVQRIENVLRHVVGQIGTSLPSGPTAAAGVGGVTRGSSGGSTGTPRGSGRNL